MKHVIFYLDRFAEKTTTPGLISETKIFKEIAKKIVSQLSGIISSYRLKNVYVVKRELGHFI